MWQEIILFLIGIVVLIYVGRKLYGIVKHSKDIQCKCGCRECMGKNQKCNSQKH